VKENATSSWWRFRFIWNEKVEIKLMANEKRDLTRFKGTSYF
jgi:hypothetical protein